MPINIHRDIHSSGFAHGDINMKKASGSGDAALLLLAALVFWMIPDIVIAVIFCLEKHSLSLLTTGGIRTVCAVIGTAVLLLSVRLFFRKRGFTTSSINVGTAFSLLPSVLAYLLSLIAAEYAGPFLLTILADTPVWAVAVQIGLGVLLVLLQGAVFTVFITGSILILKRPIRFFFRHFLTSLTASLLFGLYSQLSAVAEYVFLSFPFTESASARFTVPLISALLQTGIAWAALALIAKKGKMAETVSDSGNVPDNVTDNVTTGQHIKEKIPLGILLQRIVMAVLCVGACAFYLIMNVSVNPIKKITADLDDSLAQCSTDIGLLKVDSAVKELESAEAEIALWKEAAGIDLTEVEERALENQADRSDAIRIHAMLSGETEELESWLRVYGPDTQMELMLLDLYREKETLSAAQEDSRKQAIIDCVRIGDYTVFSVLPEVLQARAVELKLALDQYEKIGEMYHVLSMLSRSRQAVESNSDLLPEALELAEKYPDDWTAQYIAADIASGVTYDNAGHYEQTSEIIMRYESLYREEKAPMGEDLYTLERSVAQMLINVYDYENALTFLNQVPEENKDRSVFMMEADCYERLEDYEGCYDFAERYLKSHPEEPYAMYYGALSAIKLENTDGALTFMEALSDVVEGYEGNDLTALETSLYSLIQYTVFNDDSRYTQYGYAFYDSLTEEQLREIAKHAFLDHYMKAVYYDFGHGDDASEALNEIEKVLEKRNDLPNALYLKGAILFDLEEYEKAVEVYQESLAIYYDNPTVWYALANAYDGMEEYELALEACDITLSLVPEQDHGDNWYGVSVHCTRLRNAILSELE